MQLRIAAFALACATNILILSLSKDASAQTENTAVTTPAGSTHGSLVSGKLTKATGANTVTDSGLPSTPQGNGAKVQLSTGTTTTNDLARYDANGNVIDSGSAGAPPSGAAGGDLGSTYPNPAVLKVNGNTPGNSCAAHQFEISIDPSARGSCAQPASTDLSDQANIDLLNAAQTSTALKTFTGGLALPSPTNPTGSNFYIDASNVLHFVNSHDWTLFGSCFLGDCTHPYILVPFTAGASYTTTGGKSPLGCLRQDFFNGGGGNNFCTNSIYVQGNGVTVTTTAPFAAGATSLTVTANANIAAGQPVSGPGIAAGTTVSSYASGALVISPGLTVGVPSGSHLSFLVGSTGISPANSATSIQATLSQYTNQTNGLQDSTALNGFASKYFPSQTITTAGNLNCQDFTGLKSSVAGACEGAEVDVGGSGPDDAQARFGFDIIGYESGPSGDGATTIDSLVRLRPPAAESHPTPNPTTIIHPVFCTTMPGGSARGVYGSFQHCILADGGESVGIYDALSGTLTANPSATALSGQPNIQFPLTTDINAGQVVSGSANIPAGTTVLSTYQCDATNQLSGCGSVTNAELVILSNNLTGNVGTGVTLTFTGTFNDGSYFNGIFNDAFASWTSQRAAGKIKCGTLLNSGNVCDLQFFGEDSTSTTGTPYSDIVAGITSNTHGLQVGFLNFVPVGGGQVQYNGNNIATAANNLGFFSATTSAQLAGVLSDETGSGAAVFATSPLLTTPSLGAATAASINKVAFTPPASSATLTILNGKTFEADNTLTLTGTDGASLGIGGGGTLGTFAYQSYATPPAIGGTTPAAGSFTTLEASNDLKNDRHVLSNATALNSGNNAFGTGAGTSPTLNSITGDDRRFNINFTTGTTPTASAVITTVTFANAYGTAPQCSLSAAGANTAVSGMTRVYLTATTTTVVLNGVSTALAASTLYTFNINCTG